MCIRDRISCVSFLTSTFLFASNLFLPVNDSPTIRRSDSTPHMSGHDDDDRGIASTDKPSAQRARKVVTSLGGASNDE